MHRTKRSFPDKVRKCLNGCDVECDGRYVWDSGFVSPFQGEWCPVDEPQTQGFALGWYVQPLRGRSWM